MRRCILLLRGFLLGMACWCIGLASASAGDLVYVKAPGREATMKASLAATSQKLPAGRIGPWFALDTVTPVFAANGATDLSATYPSSGKTLSWRANLQFNNATWQKVDVGSRWLYRTIESDRDEETTLLVGSKRPVTIRFNGGALEGNLGPPGWLADQIANINEVVPFKVALKRGTNHLAIFFSEPTSFYFELSSVNDQLRAELDERLAADFPSEQSFYRLETIPIPPNIVLEVGGLAFMPDKSLMICTRRGEIWSLKKNQWTRFATGLHEPMGIWPGKMGEVFVMQRSELTRVVDTDKDGSADTFETINADCGVSSSQHAYIYGPVRDRAGNFWGAISGLGAEGTNRYFGWCFKVTPRGEFIPWATGLRSPNGIVLTPDEDLFIADNQGNYVGTSPLYHVTKDAFFNFPIGLKWEKSFSGDPEQAPIEELAKRRKPAAILFPYGSMGQSLSQPLVDTTKGQFGPFVGQMFIADQSKCNVMRVFLEKVDGEFQGACFPFRNGFQSGNNRMAFAPDGSLYVGQTTRGWGSIGGASQGLQRLVWTGKVPLEVYSMKLTKSGFALEFTQPLDAATACDPSSYSLQHYHYLYRQAYGSPQMENTPVALKSVRLSRDHKTVWLDLPELLTGKIYELHFNGLRDRGGNEMLHSVAYYTLNRLVKEKGAASLPQKIRTEF